MERSPWMSQGLLCSQKTKAKLFKLKIKKPTEENKNKFKQYNSVYNKTRRRAIKDYYDNQFKTFSKDMKRTWQTIREVMHTKKQKDDIPSVFIDNGRILNDWSDIANGFNNFFAGIGPELANKIPQSDLSFKTFMGTPEEDSFQFSVITPSILVKICGKLKPKNSSGPDFISTKLLTTANFFFRSS